MTIIVPTDVSTITRAVFEMLRDDPAVGVSGVQVERSAEPNMTPTEHGWLGVYRDRIDYPPRTLGMGAGYRNQRIRLFLLAQESDPTSGEECEDRLEKLLQNSIGVLLSDPSLKGTVQTLDEFSVLHEDYSKTSNGIYIQMAKIEFTGIIPVSAM
jgi:hypothetical protein